MSTSVAGYSAASDLIDLDVQCLTGEALTLQVAGTTLGKAVRRLISEQLACQKGRRLSLHHETSSFVLT